MDHPQSDEPPTEPWETAPRSGPPTRPVDGCQARPSPESVEAETGLLLAWLEGRLEPLPEHLRARLVAEGEARVRRPEPFGGPDLGEGDSARL